MFALWRVNTGSREKAPVKQYEKVGTLRPDRVMNDDSSRLSATELKKKNHCHESTFCHLIINFEFVPVSVHCVGAQQGGPKRPKIAKIDQNL